MKGEHSLAWVAIDFLCCLLLVVYTLIAPPAKPTQIETLGFYAITIEWQRGSASDVDLYVRAPSGEIVYFANSDGAYVSLEHDDLGEPDAANRERAIIRQLDPGEYVVNVHGYRLNERSLPVVVTLWRLRGEDRKLRTKTVRVADGGETTAFRFRPPRRFSDLPARFVR